MPKGVTCGSRATDREADMNRSHKTLLAIDALVNLLLGVLLLLFPAGMLELLGLPSTSSFFYPSILGAVIFGIGAALCLELWGAPVGVRGLGLGGAIAINLCGGMALLAWLLVNDLQIPLRGHFILWAVAAVVLGIGVVEIVFRSWKYDQ
jgi:hypothetical protein